MRLPQSFFNQDTLTVAQELLGKVLVFKTAAGLVSGIITETEAYTQEEASCHAFNGKRTKRNEVMFWRAGHLYVYFTYGMHFCANIVTEQEGRGCAVLIRSVLPLEGLDIIKQRRGQVQERNLVNGPAKLCQAFGFGREQNGVDLLYPEANIWIEDRGFIPTSIKQTERIGIAQAKELPWRFVGNFSKNDGMM